MEQKTVKGRVIYRSRILHGVAITLDGSYMVWYNDTMKKMYKNRDSAYEKVKYFEGLYRDGEYEKLSKELKVNLDNHPKNKELVHVQGPVDQW